MLAGPNSEHAELSIAISTEDGLLRHANFWDLDKTLLIAEPIHAKAVDQIFPEHAKDEDFHEVYFAGFALGNSFREWDRMWRIYGEGQVKYKDPLVYEREFISNDSNRKLIDESDHKEGYHERANEILQRYGKIAYDLMKTEYDKNPENFQKSFIKPEMVQLLNEKTRLGQVSVYMTANQRDFAKGLVTFSGLYKYGLALATDETMAGGGKEIAIQKLIEQLERMGLKVSKDRASAIGDSIKGDVGSATKTNLESGVLVVENDENIRDLMERAQKNNPDGAKLREIIVNTKVEVVPTKNVKQVRGIFKFGRRGSK